MYKRLFAIFAAFAMFSALPAAVAAQVGGEPDAVPIGQSGSVNETIRSFEVEATVTSDRLVKISERIEYDFGQLDKHGIYRVIPETYVRDGISYGYRYSVTGVKLDGVDEPYSESRQGDALYLKIGRELETITGSHIYTITYETDKAITFFEDHDELYWNVTGNGWEVPIERTSFRLVSPLGSDAARPFICYTGHLGSTEQDCGLTADKDALLVNSRRILNAQEGMTVVFSFPKGMINQPTESELFWEAVRDNLILLAPLLAALAMFYIWRTKGKDPAPETIIPQYESPRGMSPMVLSGALGGGAIQATGPGATATIIDMARKGYLHIEYGEKKGFFGGITQTYTFLKKQSPSEVAPAWEIRIWDGLFDQGRRDRTTFDDLKEDKFYQDVSSAGSAATKELQKLHIFVSNPYVVRTMYFLAAFMSAFVVLVIGLSSPVGGLAAAATFVVIAVFGWFMPKRTAEGTSIVAEVKGFKWFLSVTEEERLKFHNAPARTPEEFMELLPSAIALGVEKQWADQFKDIQLAPPEWAEGPRANMLTSLALIHAIDTMHSQSAAAVYSPPQSTAGGGGSGFSGGGSGGGGGGGGGGSW